MSPEDGLQFGGGPGNKRPVSEVSNQRPEDRIPIKALRAVNLLFTRIYHNLEVRSPCQFPRTGAGILVSNHTSGLDPLLLQAPCNRLITWMMAAEYFDVGPLVPVFHMLGVIPVRRNNRDSASLRSALRTLESGGILGVFPEGRIETSRELLPFQTGVALMAIKAGVPVYPAYIDGSQRGKEMVPAFVWPNRASVRFGPAVEFDRSSTSREALDTAIEAMRHAIRCLRNAV